MQHLIAAFAGFESVAVGMLQHYGDFKWRGTRCEAGQPHADPAAAMPGVLSVSVIYSPAVPCVRAKGLEAAGWHRTRIR